MYVPEHNSWWRQLTSTRDTALSRIWGRLGVTLAIAVGVTWAHRHGMLHASLTTIPFTLVGLALGVFLGFRNNTSYDRFWEGRKLWGSCVNTTRTLTRQILTLIGPQPGPSGDTAAGGLDGTGDVAALRRELVYRVIAFVHALRMHLRDEDDVVALAPFLPPEEIQNLRAERNRPVAVLQALGDRLRAAWMAGLCHPQHLPVLEASLTALTDIQGGCERIKSTPIPASYTTLIHRITACYAWALPFGIVDTVGAYTPVVVILIAYAFFGLDAIGDEIEDPFGYEVCDLPLSALSRAIEINLRQRLGETDLPAPWAPIRGVLS